MPSRRPLRERFEEKFVRGASNECWEFMGARDGSGYGSIGDGRGGVIGTHRLSYETYRGPIPSGKLIMHTCDNPPCVNPSHLEIGTFRENAIDCASKNRFGPRFGTNNARAILSEKDIHFIRNKFKKRHKEFGARALARKFGTSPSAIHDVLKGRSWTHIKNGGKHA